MTQKSERRVIAGDFKRVYLDLPSWEILAPIEGIYDEPTVYYKANLRWAKLIEGFVQHLTDIAAWKEAEDENYWGIQQIITFLERVDVPFVFPEESGCNNFLPSAAFVVYEPQNPYNNPDYIPDDLYAPPWFVNDELEYPEALGYRATDVFVDPGAINIDPIDIITLNFPRIEITVKGGGQLEIDFLAVQAGSAAILKIGSMPNIGDIITGGIIEEGVRIIDLNNDSLSVPPESDIVISEEVNIEAEPDELTTVYIVFMPVIDDSLIPLALGGGIRQIGLCAFESMAGSTGVEDVRFNQETCFLEKRINGEWLPVEGFEYLAECLGVVDMVTKQEVREAIVEAAQDVSQFIIAGSLAEPSKEVTLNTDGSRDVTTPGQSPNDPTSTVDEERRTGGAISIRQGINTIWSNMAAWYTGSVGSSGVKERLKNTYILDSGMTDLLVDDYYTARGLSQPYPTSFAITLDAYLYCKGMTRQTLFRWIYEVQASNLQALSIRLVDALTDEQLNIWENAGELLPSTDYVAYSCVPVQSETVTLNLSGLGEQKISIIQQKANHRLRIRVSGQGTDPATPGVVIDMFYRKSATNVISRESGIGYISGAGIVQPSDAKLPYKSTGIYDYTVDTATAGVLTFTRDNGTLGTGTTGTITIIVDDLGEIS
jgi:hypothetical protein